MSLIDKLEDLVVKVDTEYQEKMEAVIREIVPGMPEGNVRHAAECMCTDRMGSMMDCVNFIEMTKGYLKKITGFMNKK